MMKTIPMLLTFFISSLAILTPADATIGYAESSDQAVQPSWLADSHRHRVALFKKWLGNKPAGAPLDNRSPSSPFSMLDPTHAFKGTYVVLPREDRRMFQYLLGCVDPSEPFQCPQSEKCIALQFICDGHPGDCPGNTDENEETCIAGRGISKEKQKKDLEICSETTSKRKY